MDKGRILKVKARELVTFDIIDHFVVDEREADGYASKVVIEIGC